MNTKERFQAVLDYYGIGIERFANENGFNVADCHRITPAVQTAVNKMITAEPLLRIQCFGK